MSIGKTSQKRPWSDSLRETFDKGHRAITQHDPAFASYMENLRKVDNENRKSALKLKPLLKEASSLYDAMDYIGCSEKIYSFYFLLEEIHKRFVTLAQVITGDGNKLMTEHLTPETIQNLLKFREHSRAKNKNKYAGVDDWRTKVALLGWFNEKVKMRQRAIKTLEKQMPQLKQLKVRTKTELASAISLLPVILKQFDLLSKYRAKGDVDQYNKTVMVLNGIVQAPNAQFTKFFDQFIEPYVAYLESLEKETKPIDEPKDKDKDKDEEVGLPGLPGLPSPGEARISDLSKSVPSEGISHPTVMGPPGASPVVFPTSQISAPPGPPSSGTFMNPHVFENKPKPGNTPPSAAPIAATKPLPGPTSPTGIRKEDRKPQPGGPKSSIDGKPLPIKPPGRAWDQFAGTHEEFITKLADAPDLAALANDILAYSESLEDSDPVASLKLLAIAEGLIEN